MPIQFINSATTKGELLNNGVGAEHVQKTRCLPQGVSPSSDKLKRFASIDGDADRVVYFYVDENEKFCLLDGDKIIALVVGYLKRLTKDAGLDLQIGTFASIRSPSAPNRPLLRQVSSRRLTPTVLRRTISRKSLVFRLHAFPPESSSCTTKYGMFIVRPCDCDQRPSIRRPNLTSAFTSRRTGMELFYSVTKRRSR